MPSRPYVPHCEGCSRTNEQSEGMISLRQGGMATHLCFGCVDALHVRVTLARAAVMAMAADD